VWPHDVDSFQGSTFCLFVMVQPWNIGVCWIDEVFVTELTVVIFFFHAAVLSIKTAFNLVKIHLLFRIIPLILRATGKISSLLLTVLPSWNKVITYLLTYLLLIQWRVMFCRPCFNRFRGLKYIPVCFPNICWHSGLKNQWKYV
jgi:hypothetical protein